MDKNELTSKNLRRLAKIAGIEFHGLKKLYRGKSGKPSPAMVYQHWHGKRATHHKSEEEYIRIFKLFDMDVTHQDFYKE